MILEIDGGIAAIINIFFMTATITTTVIVGLIGATISYLGYLRNNNKDSTKRASDIATMKSEINSLRLEIEDVKKDMRANEGKIEKRLDKLDEKIDLINQNLLKIYNK